MNLSKFEYVALQIFNAKDITMNEACQKAVEFLEATNRVENLKEYKPVDVVVKGEFFDGYWMMSIICNELDIDKPLHVKLNAGDAFKEASKLARQYVDEKLIEIGCFSDVINYDDRINNRQVTKTNKDIKSGVSQR